MHVKSVTLDGFKSYSKLTKVDRFDGSFNAITGLNGSGKSNILDAICFVLGIRNLSAVRADKLQDLVYKSGQAGIKEATVSICFDNSDKSRSPKGYEDYQEITVTRKYILGTGGKYLINGMKKTEKAVFDLFATVSLNVNNPHFLIMQGRINKVINMRPMEILGLLEEAAGTKFFEKKKQESLRLMKRKEEKIQEIDEILGKQILPKVAQLRQEKEKYQEFQRLKVRVANGTKMLVAIRYRDLTAAATQARSDVEAKETDLATAKTQKAKKEQALKAVADERDELQAQIANESDNAELEDRVKQLRETHLQSEAAEKALREEVASIRKDAEEKAAGRDSDAKEAKRKEAELKRMQDEHGSTEDVGEEDKRIIQEAEAELEDLRLGRFRGKDGAPAATLAQQTLAAKEASAKAQRQLNSTDRAHKEAQRRLKSLRERLAKLPAPDPRDRERIAMAEAELAAANAALAAGGFDQERWAELGREVEDSRRRVQGANQAINDWERQNEQLKFHKRAQYSKKQVPGAAATLFACKDPAKFAAAIDTAGGRDLCSVVIESADLSQEIFRGYPKRIKFLPLDRIQPRRLPPGKLKEAKEMARRMGGEAWEASELVDTEPKFADVRDYVLSAKIICSNKEIATKLCFEKGLSTFTLQGDSYNPGGTVTGGATKGNQLIQRVVQLKALEEEAEAASAKLASLDAEEKRLRSARAEAEARRREVEKKEADLRDIRHRLQGNERGEVEEEVGRLEEEVTKLSADLAEAKEEFTATDQAVKEAEATEKDAAKVKDQRKAKLTKEMEAAKKRLTENKEKFQNAKKVLGTLRAELQQLREAMEKATEELAAGEVELAEKEASLKEAAAKAADEKGRLDEAKSAYEDYKRKLKERNALLARKDREATRLKDEVDDAEVGLARVAQELDKARQDSEGRQRQLQKLGEDEPWIAAERHLFGDKNSDLFNYGTRSLEDEQRAQADDRLRYDQLKRTVNVAAMKSLQDTQNQADELTAKRARLDKDKASLTSAIEELDEKKKEKILDAYRFVSTNFGGIFATLLPNADAKLVCADKKSPLSGLEFRIGFSGHWKESLSELSGGQKSLVALSLVLAMLKYKPAPIYILDEVDAALDLSHTQNIGEMIKRHFTQSQFIIVSLKEGMFNNANVLFKTKFIDGASTVTRHEPIKPKAKARS